MVERLAPRLFNYASILDEQTREQAIQLSTMPFIYPHVALMPDAHLGKGATVGSVIPTRGAIIPAAVGVDIGCGMIAVKTIYRREDIEGFDLRDLRERIERVVPVSAGGYNKDLTMTALDRTERLLGDSLRRGILVDLFAPNWRMQLGTLGSGNHFIEVSVDESDDIWLFLHSGSRGVGNKIAQHFIQRAKEYCARNWVTLPDPDLAYLVEGTEDFNAYIDALVWAQNFALANREEMMDRVIEQFSNWVGSGLPLEVERINCHHNYTTVVEHRGERVYLSRKGAIDAAAGVPGLIPGSMGDASYVVVGKGNELALNSAPHGAGRQHSRSAARRQFTVEQLREAMVGIEYRDTAAFIDEIPAAYKPIDQVMADAEELVEIRHTLRQLINVKGD